MIESKGWKWNTEFEDREKVWKNPSLESYGLMNRWGSQGRKAFLDLGCGLGRHAVLFGRYGFTRIHGHGLLTLSQKTDILYP